MPAVFWCNVRIGTCVRVHARTPCTVQVDTYHDRCAEHPEYVIKEEAHEQDAAHVDRSKRQMFDAF